MSGVPVEEVSIPLVGARKFARLLLTELQKSRTQCKALRTELERLGHFKTADLEKEREELAAAILLQRQRLAQEREAAEEALKEVRRKLEDAKKSIVVTDDTALLQEAGVYSYRHPLTGVVAYEARLKKLEEEIKTMVR